MLSLTRPRGLEALRTAVSKRERPHGNNAEHAIKAFARLRTVMGGTSTEKGIEEYLTLLTVSETCEYQGLDFLDFLRSGETDIDAFGDSKRRHASKSAGDSGKHAMMVDGATDFYALIRNALDMPRGDERTALLKRAMEKCPNEMLALVKQDTSVLDARLVRRQSTGRKGTPKKGYDFYALIRKALDLPRGDERTALLNRALDLGWGSGLIVDLFSDQFTTAHSSFSPSLRFK